MEIEPWYIINSKFNCENIYGINPSILPQFVVNLSKKELEEKRELYNELIDLTNYFAKKLFFFLKNIPALILISDEDGNILKVIGKEELKKEMGIKEGICFHEKYAGTNSIFLCLNHNQPIQVSGKEHFFPDLFGFSCSSCKFSLANNLTGTITLMTSLEESSSFHLGLVSSAVDSIERESELRLKNKQLHLFNEIIINSTKNGIITVDKNGFITEFNGVAEDYTGLKRNEIIGKNIDCIDLISTYISKVLFENEKFEDLEIHFPKDNNINRVCLFDVFPIYDENQLIGAYSQFRDITERFQLEQQMIANEKLSVIGKLSAGLAHEIRNPLTPISGFLQLLERNIEDAGTKRYFQIIRDELNRIKELVNNFVMVAKPEAPSRSLVDIQSIVTETVHLMKSQASLCNTSIIFIDQANDLVYVNVDKNQIKQVLMNLLQNAIEENGGNEIKVVVEENFLEKVVEVSVIDKGLGMDDEVFKNLFTPFFTTKEKGTGLGLSICNTIIQNHNGTIEVDTEKNIGTTFKIKLPIMKKQQ
ncbi:MAG TPA: PAS domain S-box protein [Bacillus bacterium]|nr:PAS domain S-box protein [Bacillus sp. (in: firmicutes)]